MGAMIDITLQMAILTLDGTSVEEAYSQVDWSSALYSGVETFHSSWVQQSTMTCFRAAFKEIGYEEYDYKKVIAYCGTTFFANALINKVFISDNNVTQKIKECLGTKALETIRSLWSLGIDKNGVEWIVAKVLGDVTNMKIQEIIDEVYTDEKK